ncbi:DNA-binding MarR family transcriptional regulator [Mycobacterium sp. BK558]|nr:DNA-binding MarR family transcriptional regulator [Mycobacterium sp. BK558]
MHINQGSRDRNVLAAWAIALSDVVRTAVEHATGMAGSGPAALVAIVADPGMSINELRRVLDLTHPGAVRLVDRLVEKGWVQRQHGVGRTVLLAPTPVGITVERQLAAAREQAVADLLTAMPEQDVHIVAGLVEPVLGATINDVDAMRRLCRLCDRNVCTSCPAELPDTGDTACS